MKEYSNFSVIDLSHTFSPETPLHQGLPHTTFREVFSHSEHTVQIHEYRIIGQCGTHIDPPVHLVPSLRSLDEIPVTELILPLVVIDVHAQVEADPDYMLQVSDVEPWEAFHGKIPSRSFVAMRSDWGKRWPDDKRFQNCDGQGTTHWPGWSLEVLQFLHEERDVTAIGHETLGTDGGIDAAKGSFERERYWLAQNKYQVELLTNLDLVPARGAQIICATPKAKSGSGFPARVFALVSCA